MTIPLSPEQLVIWRQQRNSGNSIRNIPISARLFGTVDNEAMTAAIRDLVNRHAILRTIFVENNEIPTQEILDITAAPELEIKQVSELTVAKVFNIAVDHKFDLTKEPPMRAHLFIIDQGMRTLLFVFNCMAFDNNSVSVLMNDLFTFYFARVDGSEPDLPALPIQYADYAQKVRGSLKKSGKAKKIEFSPEVLDGEPPKSEIRGIVSIRINPGLHSRLIAFSKEADVSVASAVYAGYAVFFSRLGLGDKAVFSILHSARDRRPELSSLIGHFETVLPIEVSTANNPTFVDVARRAARSYTGTCERQNRIGNNTNETDGSASNFRTLIKLKPAGVETFKFPDLNIHLNPVPATETGYELIFDLTERVDSNGKPQGIDGSVIFDRNVFAPKHMPIRLDVMMTLLKQGVQNPDTSINSLITEEKPTAWARSALVPECSAQEPDRVPLTRIATVFDNGRQERVPLTDLYSDVTAAPGWQQGYTAYQDALQCRIAWIWEEVLGISRVGVRDRFADLGGSSNNARSVIAAINKVFRKKLPVSLLCGGATIESLAATIFSELPFEAVSEIQPILSGSKPPLFFVHSDVNGGGHYTIELSQRLGADRPFLSFNPHGLNGQSLPESIEEMAAYNVTILKQMCPEGPFWLGGFCNGALVAYEMARILTREGRNIQTPLLLVEIPAVDYIEAKSPRPGPDVPVGSKTHRIWILNEIFRLTGTYKPPKYDGKVVVIQLEENHARKNAIQESWKNVVKTLDLHFMPGNHISCIGRHITELADILKQVMD